MNNKLIIRPTSSEWLSENDRFVARYFSGLGFGTLNEILNMRVFDLMNMDRIDPIRTEEILTCLYKFLNPNTLVDEAMYYGTMSQPFKYTPWRQKHRDLSTVKVKDLVLEDNINLRAIQHFYDAIRKQFFKSSEYSWRSYKFRDKKEYLAALRKRNKEASDDKN